MRSSDPCFNALYKIRSAMHQFLPYVCDSGPATAAALLHIVRDLEAILKADTADLWACVQRDPSLVEFLDSYLRNAHRPYDDEFVGLSTVEQEVWRQVSILLDKLCVNLQLCSIIINVHCLDKQLFEY